MAHLVKLHKIATFDHFELLKRLIFTFFLILDLSNFCFGNLNLLLIKREDMHFVWFSMWDGFFSHGEIHLTITWKTIQNAFSRILYTLIKLNKMCKVADHENHVRWIYLTTVLCMGEGQKYAKNLPSWMSNHFSFLKLPNRFSWLESWIYEYCSGSRSSL